MRKKQFRIEFELRELIMATDVIYYSRSRSYIYGIWYIGVGILRYYIQDQILFYFPSPTEMKFLLRLSLSSQDHITANVYVFVWYIGGKDKRVE